MSGEGVGAHDRGEWFEPDGLRFECTQCGACCTGPPGAVWFDEDEGRAIASHLGLGYDEFLKTYAFFVRGEGGGWSLRERETEHGHDCVFLDRSGGGGGVCSLYGLRPTQCRTYPFWPEMVASVRAWADAARHCEGIGRGGFVSVESIRIQRAEQSAYDERQRRGV